MSDRASQDDWEPAESAGGAAARNVDSGPFTGSEGGSGFPQEEILGKHDFGANAAGSANVGSGDIDVALGGVPTEAQVEADGVSATGGGSPGSGRVVDRVEGGAGGIDLAADEESLGEVGGP
ncbi:MAG: hypothetical protein IT337_08845 [Thermomicrobiales bacterium]|nr:hypothetical protein [Thermomicrobiales bacterium]